MKVLVTGAGGLLGNALQKVLGSQHIYHTRSDCDLLNYEDTYNYIKDKVENYGVDTIIHAAALVGGVKANMENNDTFFKENYYISNNVLKSSFELNIKNFVNVLSTCIFPNENIIYPLTPEQIDNGKPHPSNYGYSYAKRLSGYETQIFREITGDNWFSVVATNLYGAHDNFNLESSHLIPGMIHRAYQSKQSGEPFVIWGDGTPLRQFVLADDLAELLVWSIDNWNNPEHCMMVNSKEVSVLEISKIIQNKFEIPDDMIQFDKSKPAGQFKKPAISDVTHYSFKPLDIGINETIDWFVNNYNTLRK